MGDLVYIPSATNLKRLVSNIETGMSSVSEYVTLISPAILLVASENTNNFYEVVYQGSRWLVEAKDTYTVPKNIKNNNGVADVLAHCQIC